MSKSPQQPNNPKFSEHVLDLRQIADKLREDANLDQPKKKPRARLVSWIRPRKNRDEGVFSIADEKKPDPTAPPEKVQVKVTRSQKRELKKATKQAKKLEAAEVDILTPASVMAQFADQKQVEEEPPTPKRKRGRPPKQKEDEPQDPEEEELVEPVPQVEDIFGPSAEDLAETEDVPIPSSEELMDELLDGVPMSHPEPVDPGAMPGQPPIAQFSEPNMAPAPGYSFGKPPMPDEPGAPIPGAPIPGNPQLPEQPVPTPPHPGDPIPPGTPQEPTGNLPLPGQQPVTGIDPDPFIDLNGLRQEQPYFDLE